MALCARHPELTVDGVEVSFTNVRIARQLNRWKRASFRQGLAEEVHEYFEPGRFDLAYSFAVLEHVRDVDATVRSILTVLRPGGRFCFVVPMHEFRARGPIPDYQPVHGYADHCRVFSEADLRRRWGGEPGFRLAKIPGAWKHGEIPDCFEPVEFGSSSFRSPRPDPPPSRPRLSRNAVGCRHESGASFRRFAVGDGPYSAAACSKRQ